MRRLSFVVAVGLSLVGASPGLTQPGPASWIAAQKEAMKPLAALDGTWRGPVWTLDPTGQRHDLIQTERVGGLLDGSVKVIEGRGYAAGGQPAFNAFAVMSYDVAGKTYSMRSYAQGRSGDFPVEVRPDGFSWRMPAGPGAVIRYVATVKDGTWTETGDYQAEGQPPRRVMEMTLKRVGDTDWPAAGAVPPK